MDTDLEIPEAAKHSTFNTELGNGGMGRVNHERHEKQKNLKPETGAKN
jgi:hypothetical protein